MRSTHVMLLRCLLHFPTILECCPSHPLTLLFHSPSPSPPLHSSPPLPTAQCCQWLGSEPRAEPVNRLMAIPGSALTLGGSEQLSRPKMAGCDGCVTNSLLMHLSLLLRCLTATLLIHTMLQHLCLFSTTFQSVRALIWHKVSMFLCCCLSDQLNFILSEFTV